MKTKRNLWPLVYCLVLILSGVACTPRGGPPASLSPTVGAVAPLLTATPTPFPRPPYPVVPTPTSTVEPIRTPTPPISPLPTRTPTSLPPTPTPPTSPTPTRPVPRLEDYVFGTPQVVLTHTSGIGIAGWLPDSENLLIARLVPTDTTREYIETFNVQTGEQRRYGERHAGGPKPLWLETIQRIAFTNLTSLQPVSYDLWVSGYGPARARQPVQQGVTPWSVAGGGNLLAFVPQGQRQLLWADENGRPVTRPAIDLGAFGFIPEDGTTRFSMVLSPGGKKLALYNYRFGLFIVDALTGTREREIALGDRPDRGKLWVFHACWSPDGRYIAILSTAGEGLVRFMDLIVLDVTSGAIRKLDLGLSYVTEVAWAPNSRHLVIRAVVSRQGGFDREGLYLVDAVTGATRHMLPDALFGGSGDRTWNLSWSPDGNTIITGCATDTEGRLCLIPVTVQR